MKKLVKAEPWVVFLMVTVGGGLAKFTVTDYPTLTAVIHIDQMIDAFQMVNGISTAVITVYST